jgi:uncharacterized protein (DUF433 family)
MSDLIESNPEILGGKPIIKDIRVPVVLVFELIGLNYTIDEILKEYPHLDEQIILKIINLGKNVLKNLESH